MNSTEPQPIAANEVTSKPPRRKFTAKYKANIVARLEACDSASEKGALLRKEGLYSSLVTKWKQQAEEATLSGLSEKKRGPKPKRSPESIELEKLKREVQRLTTKLNHAEKIIDVQKKLSEVLGVTLAPPPPYDEDSESE